jgi:acyl-CoA dehydrogenase
MNDTNEVRTLLVDTATRLFADHCDQKLVEAAKKTAWSQALWDVLENAQLPLVSIPEENGGAGGSLSDLAAVLRVAGRCNAPVPLAETGMLAGWMLAASGAQVPPGPLAAGPVRRDDQLTLARSGSDWTLSGTVRRMPWARVATRLVVLVEAQGGVWVACVDPARCTIRPGANLAWEPRDDVSFDAVKLAAKDVVPAGPGVTRAALYERGALARAVLMVGALDRCLDLSVEYAKTRVQFGRPIAKFQAMQQELSRFADEVAAAAGATMSAVGAVERGEAGIAVGCAKVRTGEAAHAGAAIAHQVHAAIGVTEEYVLHHSTLRLQAWRSEYGSEVEWAERVGEHLLAAGADQLWPILSESAG